MKKELKHEQVTEKIIGAAYAVHNKLGYGFLEKVYRNALKIELDKIGLKAELEKPVSVYYDGQLVGDYVADMIVEDNIIIELKAVKELNEAHEVQLVNYLKATGITVGLLINFGPSVKIKRKVF